MQHVSPQIGVKHHKYPISALPTLFGGSSVIILALGSIHIGPRHALDIQRPGLQPLCGDFHEVEIALVRAVDDDQTMNKSNQTNAKAG
ncbi:MULTISPECIES: hypothetical protein [unclassified Novosphingobium]|uniref:hypothetical protein n=1 Tax=unclassified Novosphingobium TaxID=2644732 RepID=UPI00146CE02C|nr:MULTISPECIES: hypothetical protein [unclassified Novosphingobium]NMN04963.1 hypothetical protein [Novosphingobium sp. SG919]NMN87256.1 hypothetical protein [Novosphingobium sp. SG916]